MLAASLSEILIDNTILPFARLGNCQSAKALFIFALCFHPLFGNCILGKSSILVGVLKSQVEIQGSKKVNSYILLNVHKMEYRFAGISQNSPSWLEIRNFPQGEEKLAKLTRDGEETGGVPPFATLPKTNVSHLKNGGFSKSGISFSFRVYFFRCFCLLVAGFCLILWLLKAALVWVHAGHPPVIFGVENRGEVEDVTSEAPKLHQPRLTSEALAAHSWVSW